MEEKLFLLNFLKAVQERTKRESYSIFQYKEKGRILSLDCEKVGGSELNT